MGKANRFGILLLGTACFVAGWLSGNHGAADLRAGVASQQTPLVFPESARLGSNIYLQTSAEYRACCLQIYRCATQRLEQILDKAKPAKPAVVMDLDETVFDNSAFQTYLIRNNLEFTSQRWADYEEHYPQDVTLIPGAKPFIDRAEALGVTVIYLSNRSEKYRPATEAAVRAVGLSAAGLSDRLYLKSPDAVTSDKSSRRDAVNAKYNVVMYVGDNLRDFSEVFVKPDLPPGSPPADYLKAIQQRAALVDKADCHWGVDWFVLPNPVYGEWDQMIGPDPKAILHPTSMK